MRGLVVLLGLLACGLGGCGAITNTVFFHPTRNVRPLGLDGDSGWAERFTTTADGVEIQLLHLRRPGATRCLIYLHGNAGNAADRIPAGERFAEVAQCDVLLVEYRGYGSSEGSPSESGIYADARAGLAFAADRLGFSARRVVVLGRSLGAAAAIDLLAEQDAAGAVLITPFTSGRDMAWATGFGWLGWMLGNPFESIRKMPSVDEPLLVVHGTADEIIPIAQGRRVFDAAPGRKEFFEVQGGTHNRLFREPRRGYERIGAFIKRCTPIRPAKSR